MGAGLGSGLGNNLTELIEPVLGSMGYELVDVEFAAGGLLRVTIDIPDGARFIQVEDCEQVSHQLSRLFLVEDVDYGRLEISSPGLDRPLKKPADFLRFSGEKVSLRMRQPIAGRRQFTGVLMSEDTALQRARESGQEIVLQENEGQQTDAKRWVLVWRDEPEPLPGKGGKGGRKGAAVAAKGSGPNGSTARGSKKEADRKKGADPVTADPVPQGQWLAFTLDQVEKARLVPKLVF